MLVCDVPVQFPTGPAEGGGGATSQNRDYRAERRVPILRLMDMRRAPVPLLVLALATGCGQAASEVAVVEQAAGPVVSCNGPDAAFPVGLLAGAPTDLAAGDEADGALLAELQDEQTFGGGEDPLPVTDWFRVVSRDEFAAWVRSPDMQTVVASVEFSRGGGDWQYLRSAPAGCPLRLFEPGVEFAPVSSATVQGAAVELQAESGSCVGGDGPTLDRVQVTETDTSVAVVVRLRPEASAAGDDVCAGVGFGLPVQVELQQPLGDRLLLDGSEIPAVQIMTDRTS